MYLNYGNSMVIFCNIQTWCEGFHATLMITWIPVTIRSIKILKSTRNSLFHKYMHILIYICTLINSSHCWKRARRVGGNFCTLGDFESHFSGSKNGFVSSVCDLWWLWPFVKSSRPVTCDRQIDLIATVLSESVTDLIIISFGGKY